MRKPKTPRKELKLPRTKTTTIDEDLELLQKGYSLGLSSSNYDDESPPESPKVQRKKKMTKRKNTKPKPKPKPEEKKDVRTDILAEWQEDSDEEGLKGSINNDSSVEKMDESLLIDKKPDENEAVDEKKTIQLQSPPEKHLPDTDSNKNDIEKDVNEAVTSKITDDSSSGIEVDLGAKDIKKTDTAVTNDDVAFKAILESTAVVPVPDIPDVPKMLLEKKTDKKVVKTSEKTDTHPKKRFVKSFEDFELLLKLKNENKLKETNIEEEVIQNDKGMLLYPIYFSMALISFLVGSSKTVSPQKEKGKDAEQSTKDTEKVDISSEAKTKEKPEAKEVKNLEVSKLKSQLMNKLTTATEINQSPTRNTKKEEKKEAHRERKLHHKNKQERQPIESEKETKLETHCKITEENVEQQNSNDQKLMDVEHENDVHDDVSQKELKSQEIEKNLEQHKDEITTLEQETKIEDRDVGLSPISNTNTEEAKQEKSYSSFNDTTPEDIKDIDITESEEELLLKASPPDFIDKHEEEDVVKVNNNKEPELKKEEVTLESNIIEDSSNIKPEAIDNEIKQLPSTDLLPQVMPDVVKQDEITKDNVEEPVVIPAQHVITDSVLPELSNNISTEDMCPLTTLAAVSELSTTLESNMKQELNVAEVKSPCNLTVMSENELANAEVEIAAGSTNVDNESQPVTLTTFSVDYSDSSQTDKIDAGNKKITEEEKKPTSLEKSADDVSTDDNKIITEAVKLKIQSPQKSKPKVEIEKNSVESEIAKLTDTDPNTEIITEKPENTSSSKLLKILTDSKTHTSELIKSHTSGAIVQNNLIIKSGKSSVKDLVLTKITKPDMKGKIVLKPSSSAVSSKSNKPVILSEKILTPVSDSHKVTMKKITTKRHISDADDLDRYIIQRPVKRPTTDDDLPSVTSYNTYKKGTVSNASKGKARILQQTILAAAGSIIQPSVSQIQQDDNNVFDINSMPIVLSDQILIPESIENMPIVISEPVQTSSTTTKALEKINIIPKKVPTQQVKLLNKSASPVIMKETPGKVISSTIKLPSKLTKQKIYQSGSKLKSTSIITSSGKPGKFVIVPPASTSTGSKYTVGKRTQILKKPPPTLTTTSKLQSASESTGNKIMIVTDNQGQQSKVLLTPAQQKLLGYTGQTKILKSTIKGNVIQKQVLRDGSPLVTKQTTQTIVGQKPVIVTSSGTITSMSALKGDSTRFAKKITNQRLLVSTGTKSPTQCRTVVIKNTKGQTIKRISTTDPMLEQQVAEKLEAINKANAKKIITKPTPSKLVEKKTFVRKPMPTPQSSKQIVSCNSGNVNSPIPSKPMNVPPLAPISPVKKTEPQQIQTAATTTTFTDKVGEEKTEPQRPPHQLIIQDAGGYQTTITEGQILALPSETVDGQPQSYMLVTLDETGNLTPLNNEALMSLDPNLNLGGDLGNMVLHIDQSDQTNKVVAEKTENVVQEVAKTDKLQETTSKKVTEETVPMLPIASTSTTETTAEAAVQESVPVTSGDTTTVQGITCNINNGDVNQQLLITGDPAATQKFLESLTEGNPDLANLLATAEGNILIQADGQQILINTDPENQMMLMNSETSGAEGSETNTNPIFANQPAKNQDILAAALADTDVFQQDSNPIKVTGSQLSPTNGMYPLNVGNVLETSSMNSPIMTPLEIPSTNAKKIDDEADILSQVPKNVDLPITITDPNISQTVAQQQVSSLIVNDLQNNLELPLSISDPTISATATEMNSPNFVYSLPTLDDSDMNQKTFSSAISMPLLTEENEDVLSESTVALKTDDKIDKQEEPLENQDDKSNFITTIDEGLCTLRGGICNSLSEPPPDMFDFPIGSQTFNAETENKMTQDSDIPMPTSITENNQNSEETTSQEMFSEEEKLNSSESYQNFDEQKIDTPSTNTDENSCEIPVQPEIVTDLISTSEESMTDKTAISSTDESVELSLKRKIEDDADIDTDEEVKKSKVD